ncbi:helix-turn-helix transcriptional regulator [Candidatus Kaistella beijingensis]|uniref:helix-turn-helix domain-containing protein n=1 Tax=Candidatus Kaistella beijingensis TaxID=2820270 RepID=UPI001CC4CF4E|nr:helix-turn-helix transcriptional regulator [Candidatus Kaistella beijingensis]UBB89943.1 helix-turn-helix transcriptional regulator [Candidatus Kaistella beijingensis]
MIKKGIVIFIFLFTASVLYAQNKFDFEKEYERASQLTSKNIDSAETVFNLIIQNANEGKELVYAARANNMMAYLYQLRSDEHKCQEFANKSYELSEKINYSIGKAVSLRTLALQSARLGMKDDAFQKFNLAIDELNDDKTQEDYKVRGNIYAAFMGLYENDYERQSYYIKKTIENYEKLEDKKVRNSLLSNFYLSVATKYTNNQKFSYSQTIVRKAISLLPIDDIENQINVYFISAANYEGLNKQDSALYYCKISLDLAKKYEFKEHEFLIIKNLPKLYASLKDSTGISNVYLKRDSLLREKDSIKKIAINNIFVNKEKSFNTEIEKQKSHFNFVLWFGIVISILLGILIIYHFRQRKKYRKIVQQIYAENQQRQKNLTKAKETGEIIKSPSILIPNRGYKPEENNDEFYHENLNISPEIEEKIMKLLEKFEQKKGFNEKGISLYNLANSFNVNTKYLSVIIRKNKGIPFNNYITQLRINYIVDQLLNEPKFSKYRISHLAEISGFSSHSAFSSEFKKQMGRHPSIFIKELKSIK